MKPSNFVKNSSGDFIIFKAAFQSTAFGFLVLSISIASGKNPANKYIVAANTSGTPAGGFAHDFAVLKSSFLIESKAYLAYSIKGSAALKSASVDVFFSSTSYLITAHF